MLLPQLSIITIDFGAFCLLLGGSTVVRLPHAKNKIYLAFSRSAYVKKDLINKVGENGSLRFGWFHASGGTGGFAF